jgi:putative inorganic carbon (hco3(-)) transporter
MGNGVAASRNSWWAQALQNRLIALVLAMVVIVPLVAAPADSQFAGAAALAFEGFAILLLATLLWRTRWNLSRENVITFLRTGANLPVLLFFTLAAVSCALSPYKEFSVQELLKLGAGVLLYFVVAYQFRQSKHLSMLVDTLLFLAIAVSLAGMASYQLGTAGQTDALFGNRQPLASLLMILLPMVAVIAINEKGTNRQFVAQFATVLTAGCLLLAQTRSGWMGATAGLLTLGVLALMSAMRKGSSTVRGGNLAAQKHKFVLPLMLVVVSVGFFALMATQNSGIIERANTLSNTSTDLSIQGRVQRNWAGAMRMIEERPLTGWGVGQFPVRQLYFTQEGNLAPQFSVGGQRVSLAEQAHNFYLQTAAELGIPGLLLMLGVLGSFLVAGLQRVDKMDSGIRHSLLMGSMAAIVAFAVDAVGSPSWQFGQVSMFLWLMLGVGVSCIRPRLKAEEAEIAVAPSPRTTRPLAVAMACVALLAVLSTFNVAGAAKTYNGSCKQGCEFALGPSCAADFDTEDQFKNCSKACQSVPKKKRGACVSKCTKCRNCKRKCNKKLG